jgi:hypothetical protein
MKSGGIVVSYVCIKPTILLTQAPNPEKLATTSTFFSRLFPKMGAVKHFEENSY